MRWPSYWNYPRGKNPFGNSRPWSRLPAQKTETNKSLFGRLCYWTGTSQKSSFRRGIQPLQATATTQRRKWSWAKQKQHHYCWTNGYRKNLTRQNNCQNVASTSCYCWCHCTYRGGLCGRRCRKHTHTLASSRRLRPRKSRARYCIYWRNRQDCAQERQSIHHPRCFWRRCSAGIAKAIGGYCSECSTQGRTQTPRPKVCWGQYGAYSVYRWWRFWWYRTSYCQTLEHASRRVQHFCQKNYYWWGRLVGAYHSFRFKRFWAYPRNYRSFAGIDLYEYARRRGASCYFGRTQKRANQAVPTFVCDGRHWTYV